ncbi:ankyrin repeat domain-containing protein, partial [Chryseobacterium sp.]|uniref:ankyrin repeat domain-containing protein n=1 Tax=Chryseobacterium sp. TaxID=1871047 RepID=UPI0025C54EC9
MKSIILILFSIMTLLSCSDFSLRSRKKENRSQYPPSEMFKGDGLLAAQKMFEGDLAGMEQIIKDKKLPLDQLQEKKGYTLLMYASIIEDLKAMRRLLELGADPNIVIPDEGFSTPLNHAVALNNYEMLELLFSYGANPNPALGDSPMISAMMLGGFKDTERKMIDYLLEHGANINNQSYDGSNIMKAAIRDDLDLANYLLEKGGTPFIPGTDLCPMAEYIEFEEAKQRKHQKTETPYFKKLLDIKKLLIEKYKVQFPVIKDTLAQTELRIKLYEKLDERDKTSVNFNDNYGERSYRKNLESVK